MICNDIPRQGRDTGMLVLSQEMSTSKMAVLLMVGDNILFFSQSAWACVKPRIICK
jgi:hypothetical protein